MILLKIVMVGAAIIAAMVIAQDQRVPQRAGIVGVCTVTPAPSTQPYGSWYACKQGILSGFPNLEADSCDRVGIAAHQEIWRCTAPLVSLPGA